MKDRTPEQLKRLILDYAFNEIGLKEVTLRVLAENTRAIGSYKKNGFQIMTGRDEIEIIDGKPVNVIFMKINSESFR